MIGRDVIAIDGILQIFGGDAGNGGEALCYYHSPNGCIGSCIRVYHPCYLFSMLAFTNLLTPGCRIRTICTVYPSGVSTADRCELYGRTLQRFLLLSAPLHNPNIQQKHFVYTEGGAIYPPCLPFYTES